jgi:HAMP domain-containing protein
MNTEKSGVLGAFLQASLWDLPLAVQKWALANDSRELEQTMLKAFQAWTNLANQSMERVFEAEGFAGLMTASIKHLGQWQRVTRDFMDSLNAGGVKEPQPSDQIGEMREAVNRLRQEVRALTARMNLLAAGNQVELNAEEARRDEGAVH